MGEMIERVARAIIATLKTAKPEDNLSHDPYIGGVRDLRRVTIDGSFDMIAVSRAAVEATRVLPKAVLDDLSQHAEHDVEYWHGQLIDAVLKS
jgi:hypothetical protein